MTTRLKFNPCFHFLLSFILALILAAGALAGIPPARADTPLLGDTSESEVELPPVLPLTYAKVVTHHTPVYEHPLYEAMGLGPSRSLGAGYVWVSLADTQVISQGKQAWYKINENEYVRADQLDLFTPSTFQGVALSAQPQEIFGWMIFDTYASAEPGAVAGSGAPLLPRYTPITVFEAQQVGEWIWYRIDDTHWVEQRTVGLAIVSPRPEGVGPMDKWVEVNLYEQTLAAYEGDQMVYATLISSGLPQWATAQGLFQIWGKVDQAKMSGSEGYSDYYFLEDVPWTMYFERGFALHGAYWHDRFGRQHSHGCVNMPPRDAKWLFDWVTPTTGPYNWTLATAENPGTWVWVHD